MRKQDWRSINKENQITLYQKGIVTPSIFLIIKKWLERDKYSSFKRIVEGKIQPMGHSLLHSQEESVNNNINKIA